MEHFWIKNIHNLMKDYSDYEDQKTVWLGLNPNKVSSYDENLCMLFDDNEFNEFIIEWEKEGMDQATLQEMIRFKDMLNSYDVKLARKYKNYYYDEEVLADPEWLKVVNQAKKVIDVWKI